MVSLTACTLPPTKKKSEWWGGSYSASLETHIQILDQTGLWLRQRARGPGFHSIDPWQWSDEINEMESEFDAALARQWRALTG